VVREPIRMLCVGLNYGLYPGDFFPEGIGSQLPAFKIVTAPSWAERRIYRFFPSLITRGSKEGTKRCIPSFQVCCPNMAKGGQKETSPSTRRPRSLWDRTRAIPLWRLVLAEEVFPGHAITSKFPPITRLETMFDALFFGDSGI